MSSDSQVCAITGASGYVGSLISEYFTRHGWEVCELTRRSGSPVIGRCQLPFQLGLPIDPSVFLAHRIRVLVHCAYDFESRRWADIHRINVQGSEQLMQSARDGGVQRIIVISSISAFEGCRSLYGRAKLEIEAIARKLGACVVRPGLVYGSKILGGMFGSLWETIRKSSVVPMIGTGRHLQYLVHADDLCDLILKLASDEGPAPTQPIVAASPRGWQMRELLEMMSVVQNKRVKFVPLPWRVVWVGLKSLEITHMPVSFRSDSVVSLVFQDPAPHFGSALQLGVKFRDLNQSLMPESGSLIPN